METWKGLLGLAGVLVVFGATIEIAGVSLSSPAAVGLLLGVVITAPLLYLVSRRSFRAGKEVGEALTDTDDE